MIVRGKNSYAARVTDTAQGTIRSLEANVQGFEERASKLEYDIADATKRAKELETKVGAHFEREERYQQLTRRQSEIKEKLDLTKNQAPSQVDADAPDTNEQKNSEKQTQTHSPKPRCRSFYELCWHLGGSQSDIANLAAEDIDWPNQTIAYARQKTGSLAMIHFGPDIEAVLRRLPVTGALFSYYIAPMTVGAV